MSSYREFFKYIIIAASKEAKRGLNWSEFNKIRFSAVCFDLQ